MTTWPRPIPTIGDTTSAGQRARDLAGWAFSDDDRAALHAVITARRDVRRFRPDVVPDDVLEPLLVAAHSAPSVGHSQPWRFVVVRDPATRDRAAWLADAARLDQAAAMDDDAARHLLDLQLEGIREAPIGLVVCCDRRVEPVGVLGRATFPDADLWSCACAIQNLWLAARATGLGVGWVTLFRPTDLAALIGLPEGVETLGWLCIGYPDERPPAPGLERVGWSRRAPLSDVVFSERWPAAGAAPPPSRVRAPDAGRVVGSRDQTDQLLTTPGSLGVLDRAVDRVVARLGLEPTTGTLLIVAGDHPVADLGVSPYRRAVTQEVLAAAVAGTSIGASAAAAAGLELRVVDAGSATGDVANTDAMSVAATLAAIERGRTLGTELAPRGPVALGEIGIGNTTIAAALAAALLGCRGEQADALVGRGAGADSAMLDRKRDVVHRGLVRLDGCGATDIDRPIDHVVRLLSMLGGPEVALLTGAVLGIAEARGIVVLDGMLTSVAALLACQVEPAVSAHVVAGQRSREQGHATVLRRLGVEPLLDLRLRAGEGVGAALATHLLLDALGMRRSTAVVEDVAVVPSTS